MAPYSQEDVSMFEAIANVPTENARQWLDRYDDIASASDKFWEYSGRLPPVYAQSQQQQTGWDETLWSNDHDAYGPENRPPQFEIHGPDAIGQQRPNSRVETWVNNAGTLSEEEQIQRAVDQSKQESGITDSSPGLKRVDDETYKPNSQIMPWNPIAFDMDSTEPAPPDQRQRSVNGEPVFIRPSLTVKTDHLAPLLTIYHNIPLARELLLGRHAANIDYGNNPKWWNGNTINNIDEWAQPEATAADVFTETQRLVAGLDCTERAYLSIDVLESMIKDRGEGRVKELLEALAEGSMLGMGEHSSRQLKAAFQCQLRSPPKVGDPKDEANWHEDKIFPLRPAFENIEHRPHESLVILLTRIFATYCRDNHLAYFEPLPPVLTIVVKPQNGSKLDVKIPSMFNSKRFLREPPQSFVDTMHEFFEVRGMITKAEEAKRNLSFADVPDSNGRQIPYDVLLDATIRHLSLTPTPGLWTEQKLEDEEEDLMEMEDQDDEEDRKRAVLAQRAKLQSRLRERKKHTAERIKKYDEKLAELHDRINDVVAKFDVEDDVEDPENDYHLSGVSTSYDVTYVLIRPDSSCEEDLLITDSDDREPQWWRIEFTHGTPCSFSVQKVREVEVRKAASDSREEVLLVYCKPSALTQKWHALPPALQNFVEVDNENFKLELQGREESNRATSLHNDQEMVDIAVDPAYATDQQQQQQQQQPRWGGESPGPPQLPPRTAQAGMSSSASVGADNDSSTQSEQSNKENNVAAGGPSRAGSKKRGSRLTTGIRNVLSRSKSRERAAAQQVDLLTGDAEQRLLQVKEKNRILGVPGGKSNQGNTHEDKKARR